MPSPARNVELFDASQLTLDRRARLINTLLLVTGGGSPPVPYMRPAAIASPPQDAA